VVPAATLVASAVQAAPVPAAAPLPMQPAISVSVV
jgi:hypothetical protein